MNKAIKWFLIVGGGLVALIVIALLVIPMFVDLQEYKPEVEKMVAEATGRPFSIGGDIDLSLFPWVGFATSDIHLGNPPGFQEKDFASVKSIEVRVKLIPLISKDVQIKRFIVEGPRIAIEKSKSGRTNLEGLAKPSKEVPPKPKEEKERAPEGKSGVDLPIKGLAVGEFAVTEGSLLWIDHSTGERKEISDVTLRLQDVSMEAPIQLALSAMLDGRPIEIKGNVGPVGKEPGKGTMSLDLQVKALKELEMDLKGKVVEPATNQRFDLAVQVSPFSPRNLVKALGQALPMKTSDPSVLNKVAFKAKVKGDPKNVSISDGMLDLDDSKLNFSAKAMDFSKPDIAFDLNLDKIDLDRYLPPPSEEKPEQQTATKTSKPKKEKTDYGPLRRLVLDGKIRVGELKAHGATIHDLYLKVTGKDGRFELDPLTLKLYEGDVSSKGSLDVRRDTPESKMTLQAKGIQVNPLLKDFMKKDFLEGTVKATMDIALMGDDPARIKKTLTGKGDFLFNDGAIVGIDLAGMVRNVKATFGVVKEGSERPRTDFSELHSPFTITNGVVDTPKTNLISPLLRVLARGKADLVKEMLDFRVEPKFVGTIKGQGDVKERSGITVPVLVTGSFSSPKFRPDLKSMLQQRLDKELTDPSKLQRLLGDRTTKEGQPATEPSPLQKLMPGQTTKEEEPKSVEEQAKDLLKGLPFGR